jgi:hypothetical protein
MRFVIGLMELTILWLIGVTLVVLGHRAYRWLKDRLTN